MMCPNCSKLAFLYTKKKCNRCQGEVIVNIAQICELCSFNEKICSICIKKIQNKATHKGCGCGGK